jgi:hypothetical protein
MAYVAKWPNPDDRRGFAEPESFEEELADRIVVLGIQRGYERFRVTVDIAAAAPAPTAHIEIYAGWLRRFLAGSPKQIGIVLPGRMEIAGKWLDGIRVTTEVKPPPKDKRPTT